MLKAKISSLFKTITILSIITLLLTLGLLITIIVRGHRSFPFSTSVGTYFLRKYSTQIDVGLKLRITSISVAILCLVILLTLILKANSEQNEKDTSKDIGKPIFILMSLCLLTLAPVASFYASLCVQRYKVYKQEYWDEISMLLQGMLSLILITIAWMAVSQNLLAGEEEKTSSQKGLARDQEESINQQLYNIQRSIQQDRQAKLKGVLYENLFDRIGENPMEEFNKDQQANHQIIRSMMKRQREEYKNYNSKESHGKSNQNIKKLSKRWQAERIRRQLLKMQIEKRKKKFRQINPQAAHQQEDSEEMSYQSDEEGYKMANLPKPYRQYIKQAKKQKKRIPVMNQLVEQIGTALLQSNFQQTQMNQEIAIKQISPILIQELEPQAVIIDEENQQNPIFSKLQAKIKQYRRKKSNIVQGMKAEEELICTKDLKNKLRKKRLFQEAVAGNAAQRINLDNFQFQAEPPKKRQNVQPSREQQVIVKLKDRYNVQKADDQEI